MSTINSQIRTRHESARFTDQEHGGAPKVFRPAQLAKHVLFRPLLPTLRELLEELFDHGRYDVARRDGVDADAVLAPFRSEVPCQLDEAGL